MNKSPLTTDRTIPNGNIRINGHPCVIPLLLIVERDEDYAILLQRIFAKIAQHWRVARVANVKEALGYLVRNDFPDLLVTNLETPQLKASDLIEWLLCIKKPKPVSVLIFDHCPSLDQEKELAALGVKHYLNKRAPTEQYRSTLRRLSLEIDTAMDVFPSPDPPKVSGTGFARKF